MEAITVGKNKTGFPILKKSLNFFKKLDFKEKEPCKHPEKKVKKPVSNKRAKKQIDVRILGNTECQETM